MNTPTTPRHASPPTSPTSSRPSPPALRRTASTGNLVALRRRVVATVAEAEAEIAVARHVSMNATPSLTPRARPVGEVARAVSHARSLSEQGASVSQAPPVLPRVLSLGAGLSEWQRRTREATHPHGYGAGGGALHDRSHSLSSLAEGPVVPAFSSAMSVHSTNNISHNSGGGSQPPHSGVAAGTGGIGFELPHHRTLASGRSTRPIFQNMWSNEGRFLKHVFGATAPSTASAPTGVDGGRSCGASPQTPPSTGVLTPGETPQSVRTGRARRGNANSSSTLEKDGVNAPSSLVPTLTAAALANHRRAHHLQTLFATEEVLPQLMASEFELPRLFAVSEHGGSYPSVRVGRRVSQSSASGLAADAGGEEGEDDEAAALSLAHSSSSILSLSKSHRNNNGRRRDARGGALGGGGGCDGGSDDEEAMMSRSTSSDAFLYAPANFSGFRSRNLNALYAHTWDRRLFLPTTRWCLTRFFSLFASPRFWEKMDWTVRGSIFTILPTMVLCLEPTTQHIFPLPTSVVSFAYWFSQPTFGAGLRELYVVIKGFSVSLVVFSIFLAIHPGPVWLSLILMFVFVLLISFFAEQTKRTSAWCICSLTMQYTRTPSTTTFKFIGDYYVTLLIGIGFGLASFIVPYIRWSSVNAEHYLAVVADSISLSARGMCTCLWTPTPVIRQLHLARLRQLRATTEKSFAKMKTALSEMGYEPHRGVYTAQLKTRSAFFTQISYLQRSTIQMLEEVGRNPGCLDTPLCRAFAEHLGPALARYGRALDDVLVAIGRVDHIVSSEALDTFRAALKTMEDTISAAREVVVLNNPEYQTDESDLLLGFYLFHVMEMGRLTADFNENPAPPSNLIYLLRLPERDVMSLVNACRALAFSVWRRHTITRRLKESIKLSLCLLIAGVFQVYVMDNEGTSPMGGVDIIAWVYRDTGGESFTYSTHRLLGTVLGSLTGLLGVQIAGTRREVLYVVEMILCFIGTYIMASPGWAALGSAMTLSAVSMTMQFRNPNAAMVRIQQNCFAILIYFILSSFIWPVKARNKMKLGLDLSLRAFREVVWRLFRNLDLPESEANVAADASLLLTQMQKRISVQESNLAGAIGEPTFDSAEFPAVEWRTIMLDQRHLLLSLLSMRFAYHTFMSSKVDGALSVHWRVLHSIGPAAAEFSELVYAACDMYLLAVCRAALLPTAHLTRIREALMRCYADMLRAYLTTIQQVLRGDFDDLRLAHDRKEESEPFRSPDGHDEDTRRNGVAPDVPVARTGSPASPPSTHPPAPGRGSGGDAEAGVNLNRSFTDFTLTAQEVTILRQLLRLDAHQGLSVAGTTVAAGAGVDGSLVSAPPPTRRNSALRTGPPILNGTFAGPSSSVVGSAAATLNDAFFPGASALDRHESALAAERRLRTRVQGLLNRSFLGRHSAAGAGTGGPAATAAVSGGDGGECTTHGVDHGTLDDTAAAFPVYPPSLQTSAVGATTLQSLAAALQDTTRPAFTLNSSIVLPRGSYVPGPTQAPSSHPRHHLPSSDGGSMMSNREDVRVSDHGSPLSDYTATPPPTAPRHTRDGEAAASDGAHAPVKRLSRLLSRLRPGASGADKSHQHDSAADAPRAAAVAASLDLQPSGHQRATTGPEAEAEAQSGASSSHHASPSLPEPAADGAARGEVGGGRGDDDGHKGHLVSRDRASTIGSSSPPTPHNFTFVGPSGTGLGLNASFIPGRGLGNGAAAAAAAALAARSARGGRGDGVDEGDSLDRAALARPRPRRRTAAGGARTAAPTTGLAARGLDSTVATVDLFDLTRGHRTGVAAGRPQCQARITTATTTAVPVVSSPPAATPVPAPATEHDSSAATVHHHGPDERSASEERVSLVGETDDDCSPPSPPPPPSASEPPAPLQPPHSPTQLPSSLLTPLIPTAQFHSDSADARGSASPIKSLDGSPTEIAADTTEKATFASRTADQAQDTDEHLASACEVDGEQDFLPPVVLSSRDIHSLESFLYGINSILTQLDQFEQHLLEVVHANEMAKKL